MKGSYRNWAAIGLEGSFLWVNEWLKDKKQVVKKGTVFAVVVIPQYKQGEKQRGDSETAECEWHVLSKVVKTKVTVKCHGENLW